MSNPILLFVIFVGFTLGLSFWLGRKAKSSEGYFAAHGQIPWFVNGIAFAGDYLSAASFLGICGMIAVYGYDGFLYSIGYLAGWIVALFVIAEPMKRMGKFTFADALDSKFNSRGIKLVAGISTLVVSIFYLIPQMVGAGVLVEPLLNLPQAVGVVMVGAIVILIVVTAGMVSTTWVQFLKGSLLVVFSALLTWMILDRGFTTESNQEHQFIVRQVAGQELWKSQQAGTLASGDGRIEQIRDLLLQGISNDVAERERAESGSEDEIDVTTIMLEPTGDWAEIPEKDRTPEGPVRPPYLRLQHTMGDRQWVSTWRLQQAEVGVLVAEAQTLSDRDGKKYVNSLPTEDGGKLHPVGRVARLPGNKKETGGLGLFEFFSTLQESEVVVWRKDGRTYEDNIGKTTVYFPVQREGSQVLRPGEHPKFAGIRKSAFLGKLNFLSLMLALFCGTASLPHILIRYYTVKDARSARKSTIVGIASIGFFYVLTLYLGLGAMTSGAMDVTDGNMAAPLLAKSMNAFLFAAISAIAFTTVLGTVSGLILASAGAVTHDLMSNYMGREMTDAQKVRVAKIASVVVGAIAIVLGILFQGLNVSYLVGWAFSVAASANLPSLVMILFWKGVTKQGVIVAMIVGMVSSLGWILLSSDTFEKIYGIEGGGLTPFTQPGIVTIPLGFLTLIVVSLMTKNSGGLAKQD